MNENWKIDIDRDDISRAELLAHSPMPLTPGQVRLRIESYAMTANNITYALIGKPVGLFSNGQGYWDFFAERGEPGRLPVWGFAAVAESTVDGIAPGDVFYGYYPMASEVVLTAGRVSRTGFTDATPRRAAFPSFYNDYQKVDALVDYREADHDYWPIFRPLFFSGWLVADQIEDQGDYGADQILVASASSKTAIGMAFSLRQQRRPRPRNIGLTSEAHVAALAALGLYDEVVAYDDIARLDPATPSVLVDMAGSGAVTHAVHSHFASSLKASIGVGKSHWDADAAQAALPGPERQGFFAPDQNNKRIADWGSATFYQKIREDWLGFMKTVPDIVRVERRRGGEAALAAYQETLSGQADPKVGILILP